MNFEHEVIEAVIDTNYRRLIDGRSIDISLGGIHNIVVGSDIDQTFQEPVSVEWVMGTGELSLDMIHRSNASIEDHIKWDLYDFVSFFWAGN